MVKITETILRDAHQSLLATRLRLDDMLGALEMLDNAGYHSLEMWGGATFDSCIRFLNEDPWERLRTIRSKVKKTQLQMLLRGQNVVGYRHYADDVVNKFVELAAKNGIDIFRIFDALNDMRNIETALKAVKKTGKHIQGCISYTLSPVHTEDTFINFANELKLAGSNSIAIKDMAGLLTPQAAKSLVTRLKKEIGLPVQVHSHCTSGLAMMTYYSAAEAGADVLDCALSPLAWGTSQPPTESIVHGLKGTPYESNVNPDSLVGLTSYFKDIRKKYNCLINPISERIDVDVLSYQIPGGMLSNLVSQLEKQNKLDRYDDVLLEVPKVREELGFPPLVTPTSQIVGTQSVMNVISGQRYKMVTKETKAYVKGMYGKTPAPIKPEMVKKLIGDEELIKGRPADSLKSELPGVKAKYSDIIKSDEDLVMLALYQEVAAKFLKGEVVKEEIPSCNTKQKENAKKLPKSFYETGNYNVTVNGRVFNVEVVPRGDTNTVSSVQQVASSSSKQQSNGNGTVVNSPLQGTVSKLLFNIGDNINEGENIMILEAMKMENEIPSPLSGVISNIHVKEGDAVDADAPLVSIK